MRNARILPSLVLAWIAACSTPAASPADATPPATPPAVSERKDVQTSEDAAEAPRPVIQVAESAGEEGAGAPPKDGAAGEARPTGAAPCEDGVHRPGDAWKVDCNTCRCDDQGKVLCTRMACRKKNAGSSPSP